jgi:cysteine desulfurase
MLSLSGHKFYAPKGVGVRYVRGGTRLLPQQTGGGHEGNRRAGTENVPYIVGIAKALRLAQEERESENARLATLRDRLVQGVLAAIPDAQLTGHPERRLPGHASFVISGVEASGLLMHLDMAGVCAASGSACTSGMPEPSHVLMAMGIDYTLALGALRLTLGRSTSQADMDYVLETLPGIVEKLRAANPVHAPVA